MLFRKFMMFRLHCLVDPLLQSVEHRPWPPPTVRWVMKQTWHDLLFAHWPISPQVLRPLVPSQLQLDVYDGQCWLGIAPFYMSGIRVRGLPPLPGLSRFPELNVRTYVTYGGKPGVYFFSLDADNAPAVWAARTFYHLPYFQAAMTVQGRADGIYYSSRRHSRAAEFGGHYRPVSEVRLSAKGSIEHWLTERYCLYTTHCGLVYRGEVHHQPWPLQAAEAELEINTMAAAADISFPAIPPLLLFARKLDVLIWPLHCAE